MTRTVLLGDLKMKDMPLQIIDGDRGANYPKNHEFSENGYCLFLSAKNVTQDGFDFSQKQFIAKEKDEKLQKGKLEIKDIVLTTRGTVGNVAFYSSKVPFDNLRINSGMVIIRCDETQLLPEYLYLVLQSTVFQNQVLDFRSGSAQPQLPIRDMQNIRLLFPDLKTQRKIAGVLGAINEKIELNRQMNETLEQMGQALFRHYFITNPEAERWPVKKVGDLYDVLLGGTPSRAKTEYWQDGTIGWINSGKVNEFRIIEPSKHITQEALDKSAAKLLPAGTTVIAITGATLGQISRIEKEFAANQSVIGLVSLNHCSSDFIYYWIKHNIKKLIGHQTGGAQQHINRENVVNFEIPEPSSEELSSFQGKIEPISKNITNNCFAIQTLTTLRDTLLPRLISGKVKV